MRFSLAFAAACFLWSSVAFAGGDDLCIKAHVPHAQGVGHGRMTLLAWDLYDAALYAPHGIYNRNKPFALTLSYLHDFKGSDIAKESISQMKRLGLNDVSKARQWRKQMEDIFPDVSTGDEITGIYTPHGGTVFCQDGDVLGVVKDPAFGQHFFGIWLDKNAKSTSLRGRILGEDNEKNTASGDRHGS